MRSLDSENYRGVNTGIGGRRAQIRREPLVVVELEGLPSHSRMTIEDVSSDTGAWVSRRTETGMIAVSGHPDAVSQTLSSLHPPRDPSIPDSATRGLNGPLSRRALP